MNKRTAMNIIKSRGILGVGPKANVPVTNVSFSREDGTPFVWESGDSKGEPYAIANINAMNAYGKQQAQERFLAGDYQGACNTNLSARVTLEKGRQLANALFATVVMAEREIDVKDENGEPTGEVENALLIAKIVPNKVEEFSANGMKDFDFGATEDVEAETESATNMTA